MKLDQMFYISNNIKLFALIFLIANSLFYLSTASSTAKMQNPLEVKKQNISTEIDFILGKLKSTKLDVFPINLKNKIENSSTKEEDRINKEIEAALAKDTILVEFGKLDENLETYLNHFGDSADSKSNSDSDKAKNTKKKNSNNNNINKEDKIKEKSNKKDLNNNGEIDKLKNLHTNMKKISDKLTASKANENVKDKGKKKAERENKSKEAKSVAEIKGKDNKIAQRVNLVDKESSKENAENAGKNKQRKTKSELDKMKKLHKKAELPKESIKQISEKKKEAGKASTKKEKMKKPKSKNLPNVNKNKKTHSTKIINNSEDIEVINEDYDKNFEKIAEQNIQRLNNTANNPEEEYEEEENSAEKAPNALFKSDLVSQEEEVDDSRSPNKTEAVKNRNKKDKENDGDFEYQENKEIKKLIKRNKKPLEQTDAKSIKKLKQLIDEKHKEHKNQKINSEKAKANENSKKQKKPEAEASSIKKIISNKKRAKKDEQKNTNSNKKAKVVEPINSPLSRNIIPVASENLILTLENDFNNLNNLESDINKTNNQIAGEIQKIASSKNIEDGKKIEKILQLVSSIKSLINQENKIVNMKKTLLQRIYTENAKNAENIQLIKSQIVKKVNTDAKEKAAFNVNSVLDIIADLKEQISQVHSISKQDSYENENKIRNQNSPLVHNYIIINKSDIDGAFGDKDYPVEYQSLEGEEFYAENNGKREKAAKGKEKEKNSAKAISEKNKNKNVNKGQKTKKLKAAEKNEDKQVEKKLKEEKAISKKTNPTNVEEKAKKNKKAKSKEKNKNKPREPKKLKKEKKPESTKDQSESKANKKEKEGSRLEAQKLSKGANKNLKKTQANPSSGSVNKVKENKKENQEAEQQNSDFEENNIEKIKSKSLNQKQTNRTETLSSIKNNTSTEETEKLKNNKTISETENENSNKSKSTPSIPTFLESKSHKMKARKFKNKKPFMDLSSIEDSNFGLSPYKETQESEAAVDAFTRVKPNSKSLLELKKKLKLLAFSLRPEASEREIAYLFEKSKTEILNSNLFSSADAQAFNAILSKQDFEVSDVELLKKKNFKLNNFIEIIGDFYKHLTQSVANLHDEFIKKITLNKIKKHIDIVHQLKSLSIMFMRSLHILNKNVLTKQENEDFLKRLSQKLLEVKRLLKDYFHKVHNKEKPEDSDIQQLKNYKEQINNYLDLYKTIKIRNNNIAVSNSVMRKIIETNSNILKEETMVKILEKEN